MITTMDAFMNTEIALRRRCASSRSRARATCPSANGSSIFSARAVSTRSSSSVGRARPLCCSSSDSSNGDRNTPATLAREALKMVATTLPRAAWVNTMQLDTVVGSTASA